MRGKHTSTWAHAETGDNRTRELKINPLLVWACAHDDVANYAEAAGLVDSAHWSLRKMTITETLSRDPRASA